MYIYVSFQLTVGSAFKNNIEEENGVELKKVAPSMCVHNL